MSNAVLSLRDVRRSFQQGGSLLEVLSGANLQIHPGEIVALVGPSGSGKSTLLQIAGLLDTPTSGAVAIMGEDMSGAGDAKRTQARRGKIGFVYQFHHLLPEFSALENVMLQQMLSGVSAPQAEEEARKWLAQLGVEAREKHRPAKLSGGEQQRVAIARALAAKPKLLLADEPTGNLDIHTSEDVFGLMTRLVKEQGLASLVATHNLDLAKRMDRIVRLEDGVLK